MTLAAADLADLGHSRLQITIANDGAPPLGPAGAARATPNSESLARPVTRIALHVLSSQSLFLVLLYEAGKNIDLQRKREKNWCPHRRHPLHAYRYYNDTVTRGGTSSLVSFWSSSLRASATSDPPPTTSVSSSKHSLTRHGLLAGSSTSGTGWDRTIMIDELSKHERGHGGAGRLCMYEERRGAPPDDLVPSALLTLSARAPVPVPSPRPSPADGVEPARGMDTASTDLPTHTNTDVAIRESEEAAGPVPLDTVPRVCMGMGIVPALLLRTRRSFSSLCLPRLRARPGSSARTPSRPPPTAHHAHALGLETSKIIRGGRLGSHDTAGMCITRPYAPRHRGRGREQQARALDGAGMCITSRPRMRRPFSSQSACARVLVRSSSSHIKSPAARAPPGSAPRTTLSLRLAHPRLVYRLRIGLGVSLILPSLFFSPLHILPCAEQAKSGKRIPHASPASPFADGRPTNAMLRGGAERAGMRVPSNGARTAGARRRGRRWKRGRARVNESSSSAGTQEQAEVGRAAGGGERKDTNDQARHGAERGQRRVPRGDAYVRMHGSSAGDLGCACL
ncbi:hypothetical protein B0H14DRAFT_3437729 [Mycena olivaceomarginata]|nr:hypothetical protein B0H14DRAFT_3437729 [Mycena olivaceomarginata]